MSDADTFSHTDESGIAIIGMACQFPGAKNLDEYWQNLRDGVESITFFSDEELLAAGIDPVALSNPNYVKASPVLEDAELFDAAFFGFNPREAEIIDPQHRVFLECAWHALEHAGYDSENYKGAIGVYAGASINTYFLSNLYPNRDLEESVGVGQIRMGNRIDNLATRVSYKLNLKGPSLTVQTNCSTSLVAVHLACQSLLNGECGMALAGGVRVGGARKEGYFYQEGGILSPDGHCRAFDAKAQGTLGGEGVGIVVLKRLEDAIADGDSVHAVIKGSAINNDGSLKVGYTAPSVDGQAEVISEALALAGVRPETVTLIEAHGTGTSLGDPIEVAALTQVFRSATEQKNFCAIGSVKTNIGHTDSAAGVASLIKTVLALKHKLLPPSLHFTEPNPEIDFANSAFYVNTELKEWDANGNPRRAGVSSFGVGGTNAHAVLEEAPVRGKLECSRPAHLLMLSAKTSSALEIMTADLLVYLKQHPEINLADVAYTLAVGRRAFKHRRILVSADLKDAVSALETLDPKRVFTTDGDSKDRAVVFMFSGQGAQYVNMASELYRTEPTFRDEVDTCARLLEPHLGLDVRELLFPHQAGRAEEAARQLKQTSITQPALFVIEYALARLWMEWGVYPEAMIGHSIGEYVAACLADVFSLEDTLALVAMRGRMMQQLPGGAMLAVPLREAEVQPLLGERLSLAAINGSAMCVVSGTEEAIDELEARLAEQEVKTRRLHTSHAFHSAAMDSILEPFIEQVSKLKLNPPRIPYISNVTGTWIKAAEAAAPSYWAKHLRHTVRFADGLQELLKEPSRVLLEVGPGQTLSTLAKQHPERTVEQIVLPSLPHVHDRHSDAAFLLNTLGRLWLAGVGVNWPKFYANETRGRVPLPTYPFERERFWIEPLAPTGGGFRQQRLSKKTDIADWFYIPSWKRSAPVQLSPQTDEGDQTSCWLIFSDSCGIGDQMAKRIEGAGHEVVTVTPGERFTKLGEHRYEIDPGQPDDYNVLLQGLRAQNRVPQVIAHLWSVTPVTPDGQRQTEIEPIEKAEELYFYSLLFLAQAIAKQDITEPIQIGVVSNNMQEVTGEEELSPEKALVLGPCRVIPHEHPNIACRSIDVVISSTRQHEKLTDQLIAELAGKQSGSVVAYRGNHRWTETFEPVRLEQTASKETPRLREEGVYLVTGGTGGIGLELAEHLARMVRAKLILTGRSAFPEKAEWTKWLAEHGDQDTISRKLGKLQALEGMGAEVLVVSADVSDQEQMQEAVRQGRERFGEIHGVIHAAGIAGGGMIQLKTSEVAAGVLAPKVRGTVVLDAIFKDAQPDFLVLCSARTAILGGFGQVDYTAANAFLDRFAHYNNHRGRLFTVSINWGTWREVGMAVNTEVPLQIKERREESLKTGMLPSEGVEAFSRILRNDLPQVIVSTEDFGVWVEQAKQSTAQDLLKDLEKKRPSKPAHSRPAVSSTYKAPTNETEGVVAGIWQELLGIEQVGTGDDFFELGGHSLLGLQVISRLRNSFHVELPLRCLFESPTVAELAEVIAQALVEKAAPDKMAHMLAELEELSDEEAQRLLDAEMIGDKEMLPSTDGRAEVDRAALLQRTE